MLKAQEHAVAEALKKCVPDAEQAGRGRWRFALSNGSVQQVRARLEEGWLLLDAPTCAALAPDRVWPLLEWNAHLGGMSKLVLPAGQRAVHLRAEILVDEDVNLVPRVQDTCAGFQMGLTKLHEVGSSAQGRPARRADSVEDLPPASGLASTRVADLGRVCREAGWPFVERATGSLAVDLDVPGRFHQGVIEELSDGRVRIAADLAPSEPLADEGRQALAALLVTAGSVLSLVRPVVVRDPEGGGDHWAPAFEVTFRAPLGPVEMDRALAALSEACRICAREARALRDRRVAEEYLKQRASAEQP